MMNKFLVASMAVIIVAICTSSINIPNKLSHANGASVTGYSGGCSSCHTKGTAGSISLTGLPQTIIAGNQYTIGIQITQTNTAQNWGFDLLAGSGTLSSSNSVIGVTAGKNNAFHISPPTIAGNTYTFSNIIWTAPTTPGNATFKFAGLAGTGSGSGGSCYNSKLTVAVVAPTPVEFTSFNAKAINNAVLLNWVVAEQVNTSIYKIEKSFDGINFYTLSNINSNENSVEPQSYSFTDTTPNTSNIVYYRIKEVDKNGVTTNSSVKSVTPSNSFSNNKVVIYPNPLSVGQKLNVKYISSVKTKSTFYIIDSQGAKVKIYSVLLNEGINELSINTDHLLSGIYYLSLNTSEKNCIQTPFIIK